MRSLAFALAVVLCGIGPAARAEDEPPPLHERVNVAIDRGVSWLRSAQHEDGSWGTTAYAGARSYDGQDGAYDFPAGPTAFALYTLLKCEVEPDAPEIERGFAWLSKLRGELSTYEIAAMILAIEARHNQTKRERKREAAAELATKPGKRPDLRVKLPKADAAWMRKLVEALEDRHMKPGWRYFRPNSPQNVGADQDTSATAMSMLAILAAHRCGIDVPRKLVVGTVRWTLDQQDADGPLAADSGPLKGAQVRGWAYVRDTPLDTERTVTDGNMTTAAMISLLCAQRVLEKKGPVALKKLQPKIDVAIRDGIAWLDAHWTVTKNPQGTHYLYMYLYGLERVGDLRRTPMLGGHDWYTEGATLLVDQQEQGGRWLKKDTHPPFDTLNTCFALLFLDRASLAVTTGGR